MQKAKFVEVGGIRTRYFEKGKGQTLVLIHGGQYGSYYSAYSWSLNFNYLSKHFRVIAPDCLGMGYTDNPGSDQEFHMGSMLKHLYKLIEKLGLEDANVVGHSRGALLAASLQMEYPDLARTLTIIDSNSIAPDDESTHTNFYELVARKSLPVETVKSVQTEARMNSYSMDHLTSDFCKEMFTISHLPKVILAKQKMKLLKDHIFIPEFRARKKRLLKTIEDHGIQIPTLVVWGYNDPSAPIDLGISLYRLLNKGTSKSEFHVFNKAGHYCFREHPGEFNTLLEGFVSAQ